MSLRSFLVSDAVTCLNYRSSENHVKKVEGQKKVKTICVSSGTERLERKSISVCG